MAQRGSQHRVSGCDETAIGLPRPHRELSWGQSTSRLTQAVGGCGSGGWRTGGFSLLLATGWRPLAALRSHCPSSPLWVLTRLPASSESAKGRHSSRTVSGVKQGHVILHSPSFAVFCRVGARPSPPTPGPGDITLHQHQQAVSRPHIRRELIVRCGGGIDPHPLFSLEYLFAPVTLVRKYFPFSIDFHGVLLKINELLSVGEISFNI